MVSPELLYGKVPSCLLPSSGSYFGGEGHHKGLLPVTLLCMKILGVNKITGWGKHDYVVD